ncbi:hypothetical protein ABB37_01316 [Leptomonas pyrrhocoris]|uniref:Uncharacterized protein n=1 Tax=Leptomonas pyrrhocoris TaxID=157538 RepID=A0A0N0DZ33_LEPPY|nr:hypothetical protein ABB37_01316 [Leptomonas pyrrhocoris]KPA84848.1 hypothetical protein ABB37_01316 [Leptomonas pyrrhocoris]|eukprot:XP_015663287.1 hypothetical protein ABB37_01316 [Leptomonas pyrrhocoris]
MSSSPAPEHALASSPSEVPLTSSKSIVTAVGRLLMDYALQLRDDVGPPHRDAPHAVIKTEDNDEGRSSADDKGMGAFVDGSVAATEAEVATQLTQADVAECRGRLQRLQRIHRTLLYSVGAPTLSNSNDGRDGSFVASQGVREEEDERMDDYSETIQRNSVLTKVLRRLERINQRFQGTSSVVASQFQPTMASLADTDADIAVNRNMADMASQETSRTPRTVEPLMTPVSLAEGALSAFSRNVGVVFRRRPAGGVAAGAPAGAPLEASRSSTNGKRAREGDEATKEPLNHWATLAAQQRKSRFALYTLRSALLPRVDLVCAPLYVSPAVRELAQLNAAAECFMLERAWCVHTKAHLLREAPSLAQDVEVHQQNLREALKNYPLARQEEYIRNVSYLRFVCADYGVLRLCVQHALFVDLTYDLKRKQWTLLALHWNLYTTAAGASLISSALTDTTTATSPAAAAALQGDSISFDSDSCRTSEVHQQLQPENKEALFAFLQKAFTQGGLSGGVQASNRLACAVVLDALATQLQHLQQFFFTGGSMARLIDVEVRPGTFISFHLTLPELLGAKHNTATPAGMDAVHVKVAVCGGTVMMERVRGTDLASRAVTLLLGASSLLPSQSSVVKGPARVVVDMEALLWQCLSAEN